MSIPAPIVTSKVSGYDWGAPMPAGGWTGNGQSYGWSTHQGVDYGTPPGSAITAPFGGTATFEQGLIGYGNRLTLTLANGWKFVFGHVASGVSGPVTAGQKIGVTGSNIGSAQGAVTLVEVHNASGTAVNPHSIFDPIFSGVASATSLFGAAAGSMLNQGNPCSGLSGQALLDCMAKQPNSAVYSGPSGYGAPSADGKTTDFFGIGQAIHDGIASLLPTSVHIYRAFFVGLGLTLLAAGALLYFKGDELRADAIQAGKVAAIA